MTKKASISYLGLSLGILLLLPVALAAPSPSITTFTSPNVQTDGRFGESVAVSGNILVVGALFETAGASPPCPCARAGHAYIFSTTGSLIATLTSPNVETDGWFGFPVAVSGTIVVVGAENETVGGIVGAGHAYIFSTTGSLIATLASPNAQSNGRFGESVAVSGNTVIVGAPQESVSGLTQAGHSYVFTIAGSLIATLTSPNLQSFEYFGFSAATSGSTVVVGAPVAGAGHAYICSTTACPATGTLTSPNAVPSGSFGRSVAMSGSSIVIGAYFESVNGLRAGRAYIFNITGSLNATLVSPNPTNNGYFGFEVAINGTRVVVGAPFEGHAYICSAAGCPATGALSSPNGIIAVRFGWSVGVVPLAHRHFGVIVGDSGVTAGTSPPCPCSGAGHAYMYTLRS